MSWIDELLRTTDRAAAIRALADAERQWAAPETQSLLKLINEQDDYACPVGPYEFDVDHVLSSDKSLALCLHGLSFVEAQLRDMAWLLAFAFGRLRRLVEESGDVALLHQPLLEAISRWSLRCPKDIETLAAPVSECLMEIQQSLLREHRVASRGIYGAVLLLQRSGVLLRNIESYPGVFSLNETRNAVQAAKVTDDVEYALERGGLAAYGSPAAFPALMLCTPYALLSQELYEDLPWCRPERHLPEYAQVFWRDRSEIVERLTISDCEMIVRDIVRVE